MVRIVRPLFLACWAAAGILFYPCEQAGAAETPFDLELLPFLQLEPKETRTEAYLAIHYVTDRKVLAEEIKKAEDAGAVVDYEQAFTQEPGPRDALVAGRLTMIAPANRPPANPTFGNTSTSATVQQIRIHKNKFLHTPREFLDDMRSSVASPTIAPLLHLHGWMTSFSQGADRTAVLALDLAYEGPVVLFSWASETGYADARDRIIEVSKRHVAIVMHTLKRSVAEDVKLVAHSMGAELLSRSLQLIAEDLPDPNAPIISASVLVTPDVEFTAFTNVYAKTAAQASRKTTIYCSDSDYMLSLAESVPDFVARTLPRMFTRLGPRLGKCSTVPNLPLGIELLRVDGGGHWIHLDHRKAQLDIASFLRSGDSATQRASQSSNLQRTRGWWVVPK